MLGKINILFTRSKLAAKRISSLVLTVFMLQVIAAGFCAPMVSVAPVKQVSMMEHCMTGGMSMADTSIDKTMGAHACAHCDLPDVHLAVDKHSIDAANLVMDLVVLAIVPTALDMKVLAFVDVSPGVLTPQNSLSTFYLNLRTRV